MVSSTGHLPLSDFIADLRDRKIKNFGYIRSIPIFAHPFAPYDLTLLMVHKIDIATLNDIDRAAEEFLRQVAGRKLLAFYAPMGAGKTTFTVALCKTLGVTDVICSPTFTIINEYRAGDGSPVYHFDFYRIKNNAEAMDIGVEDYFYSGCLCIMEWPENIDELLPAETLKARITVNPDDSRTISWED